jgi:hypothetical protein
MEAVINNSEKIKAVGGKRTGSGRPKGSLNRSRDEVRAIIESVIPLKEQFQLLAELSRGIWMEDKITHKVYREQPNVKALIALVEHTIGKPAQAVDVTSDGESLVQNPFEFLAEIFATDDKLKKTLSMLLETNNIITSDKQEEFDELKPTNGNGKEN